MRELKEFTFSEWIQLLPLIHALKQARNDVWLADYKHRCPGNLPAFLNEVTSLAGSNIALVVAFEQPWALDWQLQMAKRHLLDTSILVFDNSRNVAARAQIEGVCRQRQTPYLGLPPNRTRHVNRSHGMAMTWIFHNVVRAIKPRLFAYLDHDLIPVKKVVLSERLGDQAFFGLAQPSEKFHAWQLWAGYCMFDFSAVAGMPLNFLYDFSNGLDTGGRNWPKLYCRHERNHLRFASDNRIEATDPVTGSAVSVQVVDDSWFHIGGIGYNDNFRLKSQFCENLAKVFTEEKTWDQFYRTPLKDKIRQKVGN